MKLQETSLHIESTKPKIAVPQKSLAWSDPHAACSLLTRGDFCAIAFVHTSPFGEIRGREAYLDLIRDNPEAFFSPTIKILDVLEDSDKFAARYLLDDNPSCDCIYVRNGQISEIYAYYHYGDKPSF